jgi:hypothetical protein
MTLNGPAYRWCFFSSRSGATLSSALFASSLVLEEALHFLSEEVSSKSSPLFWFGGKVVFQRESPVKSKIERSHAAKLV